VRTDRLLINDILDAIREIDATLPATLQDFLNDKLVRSHIFLHVQFIGEASTKISRLLRDKNPHVPWKQMIGMRHVLVHDYFSIDYERLYFTARDDLRQLQNSIETILLSLDLPPA